MQPHTSEDASNTGSVPVIFPATDTTGKIGPLFANTRLLILSRSPTRRIVLEKIFRHFFTVRGYNLADASGIGNMEQISDIILLDRHNIEPDYHGIYMNLLEQTSLPHVVINSSEIPAERFTRRRWVSSTSETIISAYIEFQQGLISVKAADNRDEIGATEEVLSDKKSPNSSSIIDDIDAEIERRRLDAILERLPMQRFHETDNERPLMTATEMEFDFSKAETAHWEHPVFEENQPEPYSPAPSSMPDFSDFDDIFGSDVETDLSRLSTQPPAGTLKTWFSSIIGKLRKKKRKAG